MIYNKVYAGRCEHWSWKQEIRYRNVDDTLRSLLYEIHDYESKLLQIKTSTFLHFL